MLRIMSARASEAEHGWLSTDRVDPRVQLDAWREALTRVFFPMRVEGTRQGRFVGSVRSSVFGQLQLTEVAAESESVRRTVRLASVDDNDHYSIAVQMHGSYGISHDGRDTSVGPGDFTVYDCTRPWEMHFERPHTTLVALFPRRALPFSPKDMAEVTARRISGRNGVGALVRPLLLQLGAHPEEYAGVEARASATTLDLIGTLIGELLGASVTDSKTSRDSLLWRVKLYIESNLGDPELSPTTVAAAHYISLRTLHNLFREEEMTLAQLIRHRRLERCRANLTDPSWAGKSIQEIAARCGFVNNAHFSQLFRRHYGETPSELRVREQGRALRR